MEIKTKDRVMKTKKQEEDSGWFGCIGFIGCAIIVFYLLSSCTSTRYTYTVTHRNGTEVIYYNRAEAIEYHDKQNYRKPNSVWIDSTKIKE